MQGACDSGLEHVTAAFEENLAGLCFACAMNRMPAGTIVGDERSHRFHDAVYASLTEQPEKHP